MLSHMHMSVPYEYTHVGRPIRTSHTCMGQYMHMGQNSNKLFNSSRNLLKAKIITVKLKDSVQMCH